MPGVLAALLVAAAPPRMPQDTLRTAVADVVVLPPDPAAAARVARFVDTGYRRLRAYTGYDLDRLMNRIRGNPDVHHPRYLYEVLPPERMWTPGWRGGLTAWNHSQIASTLLPGLDADSARRGNPAVAILWHELSNGWANVFVDYRGRDTNLPWWFASEGHAGFWKQHILTDEGLPAEAVREYAGAVAQYDRYMADPACTEQRGSARCDPGSVTHVLLESLWRAHGWAPFRAVYDAVQRGELMFPRGNDGREATGQLAFLISRAVRRDITPWLVRHRLDVSPGWAARIRARHWPADSIATARDLGPAAGGAHGADFAPHFGRAGSRKMPPRPVREGIARSIFRADLEGGRPAGAADLD